MSFFATIHEEAARRKLRDAPTSDWLEFPAAPNYISRPPKVELQAMLRRIEENLSWRNGRPSEHKRRLAEKIPVEFVL